MSDRFVAVKEGSPSPKKPTVENKTTQTKTSAPIKLNMAENFFLSGAAAIISKTMAAPIERVKLMVQNQGEMLKSKSISTPYKGMYDCAKRTLAEEGVLSFWRGNSANVLRYFPTQALNFAFKDKIKKLFPFDKNESYAKSFSKNILSGGLAGSISLFFVYSLDYGRTRLANDTKGSKKGAQRQFKGLLDVFRQTLRADGFKGLYRGFNISIIGIFVYRGFYFGLYDSIKPLLPHNMDNILSHFALGYMVTMAAGLVSYPIDTVRRRMMMTSGTGVNYRSSTHCLSEILKNEGSYALMKGAGANILRGFAGAAVLALFDEFTEFYVKMKAARL